MELKHKGLLELKTGKTVLNDIYEINIIKCDSITQNILNDL